MVRYHPTQPSSPVRRPDPGMSGRSGEVLWQDPRMSSQTGEDDPISTSCIAPSQVTHGMGIIPSNLTHIPPPKPQPHARLGCGIEAITPAPQQNPPVCCRTGEGNHTYAAGMAPSWITRDSSTFTHGSSPWPQMGTTITKVYTSHPFLQTQLLTQRPPQTPSNGFSVLPQLV